MNLKITCGLSLLAAALFSPSAFGQTSGQETPEEPAPTIFRLDGLARLDWQMNQLDGHTQDDNTGFRGRYLMLRVDGRIAPGFTYSWRQRINNTLATTQFFDATDWIWLNYAYKGLNLNAGKQIVAIGGYEYDRHPADLYCCSVWWNNVACYQMGVSAAYDLGKDDRLLLQVCQSPYRSLTGNNNTYAYNIMWTTDHSFLESVGKFQTIWSANLWEYEKGKYMNYLSLGNKMDIGPFCAEIDFMNRFTKGQRGYLFRDCSVVGDLSVELGKRWKIHGKYTYDVNNTGLQEDIYVIDGTHLNMAGGGVEFFPLLKDRTSLRLHAAAYYSWGQNMNPNVMMQNKSLFVCAGLTWQMNFLNIKKK